MSIPIPARYQDFWADFARRCATDPSPRFREACFFADTEAVVNELTELVVLGRKRATTGLLWEYEFAGVALPRLGELSIVTRFDGTPRCVIETTQVDLLPMDQVDEAFAAVEGEGDGSLAHWRAVHEAYFARQCVQIGREPRPDMTVVCERFALVHVPDSLRHARREVP